MKIEAKYARRYLEQQKLKAKVAENLFDPNFPQQEAFYKDPSRLKCLFCTRRAAKSFTLGLCAISEAVKYPGSNILLIGLTRASAKGIFWKDILKFIVKKHKLTARFNSSELTLTMGNGSIIHVAGIDDNEDLMNAWLGRKYRFVGVDEGSVYTVNLRHFIYDILKPAMADERGTIALAGTSSNFVQGLFFDVTNKKEQGWSLHAWTAHDNPHVRVQWKEELEDIRTNRPLYMETPQFRQWFLNEWVIEQDKLVYKFNSERNLYVDLPHPQNTKGWTFNLGVDTGWEDDNAFVLSGYHENDPNFYVIKTFKKKHMTFDMVEAKIREFMADPKFPISQVIIDGANKQGVMTMNMRSNINFTFADKLGKADHIEICNGDLVQAKIKIHIGCRELIDEMMSLVWKTSGDRIVYPKKEHPTLPNHLCDAFLYGWFNGYHYLSVPSRIATRYGSAEYIKEQEDLHKQALCDKIKEAEAQKKGEGVLGVFPKVNGRDPWNNWD
jgi:hypothetical protein